jgi:acyl carrier protein
MKEQIRNFLLSQTISDYGGEMRDDESLLEAGLIDSARMIELIAFLEERFDISVEEEDLIPENFDSIEAIASYVESKSN